MLRGAYKAWKETSQWKRKTQGKEKKHPLKLKLFIFWSFQDRKRNINKLSYFSNCRGLRDRERVNLSPPYKKKYLKKGNTKAADSKEV